MEVHDYPENYSLGWIRMYRSLCNHWLWHEKPFTKGQAWVDMLLECNHSGQKVNIKNELIICERGESLNSLDTWAKRWGWNKSKVRRFIDLLQKDSMIELKSTQQTTHVRVVNYNTYNGKQHSERNTDETQMKRRRNAVGTKQELKNDKNDKNDIYAREIKFRDTLTPFVAEYGEEMMRDFYKYWKEPNKSKTKMRWELEKTWDVHLRLQRWARNQRVDK